MAGGKICGSGLHAPVGWQRTASTSTYFMTHHRFCKLYLEFSTHSRLQQLRPRRRGPPGKTWYPRSRCVVQLHRKASLPPANSKLTDQEFHKVVNSSILTSDRRKVYPSDFNPQRPASKRTGAIPESRLSSRTRTETRGMLSYMAAINCTGQKASPAGPSYET